MNEKKLSYKKILQSDPAIPWQRLVDSNIESMIVANPTARKGTSTGTCSNKKNINRVKKSVKDGKDEGGALTCAQQKSFQINENRENINTATKQKLFQGTEIRASDQTIEENLLLNVAVSTKIHEIPLPNQMHGSYRLNIPSVDSDSINQDPNIKNDTTFGDSRRKNKSSTSATCLPQEDSTMTLSSWQTQNQCGINSDCERDQESESSEDELHETHSSSLNVGDISHQQQAVNLSEETQLDDGKIGHILKRPHEAQDLKNKSNKISYNEENNYAEGLISPDNITGDNVKACDVKEYREIINDTASDLSFLDSMNNISIRDGLVKDDNDGCIDSVVEHIQRSHVRSNNTSSKESSSFTSLTCSIVGGYACETARTACPIDQNKFEKNTLIGKSRDDTDLKELEVCILHKQSKDMYFTTFEKATSKSDFVGSSTYEESPQIWDEVEQSEHKLPILSNTPLGRAVENAKKKVQSCLQKSDYAKVYTAPLNTSTIAFQHPPFHETKDLHTESKHEIVHFNQQKFSEGNDAFVYPMDSSCSETREFQCRENNAFGTDFSAMTDCQFLSSIHLECKKDSDVPFIAEPKCPYLADCINCRSHKCRANVKPGKPVIDKCEIDVLGAGFYPNSENVIHEKCEVIEDLEKGVAFMSKSQALSGKHGNKEPRPNDITKVDFDCNASHDEMQNYGQREKGKDVRISVVPTTISSTIHTDSDAIKEGKEDMCIETDDLSNNEIFIRPHRSISTHDNSLKSNGNTGNSGIELTTLNLNMAAKRAELTKGEIEHRTVSPISHHFRNKTDNLIDSRIPFINNIDGFELHESLGRNVAMPFSKDATVVKNRLVGRKMGYLQRNEKLPIIAKGEDICELYTKSGAECGGVPATNKDEQMPISIKGKSLAQSPSTPWKRLMETNIDSMLNSHHSTPLLDKETMTADYFCTKRTENHDIQRNDFISPSDSHLKEYVAPFAGATCFQSNDRFLMSKQFFPHKDKNTVPTLMKTFVAAKNPMESSQTGKISMTTNYSHHFHMKSISDRHHKPLSKNCDRDQMTFSSTSDVGSEMYPSSLSFSSETKTYGGWLENSPSEIAKASESQPEVFILSPGSQQLTPPTINSAESNETPYFVEASPSSTHINTDHIRTNDVMQYTKSIRELSSDINSFRQYVRNSNHRGRVEENSHNSDVVSEFSRPKNSSSASGCEQENFFPKTTKPLKNNSSSEFRKDNVKVTSASEKEPGKSALRNNTSVLDPKTNNDETIDIKIPSEFSDILTGTASETVFGVSSTFESSFKHFNNEKHHQVSDENHQYVRKSGVACLVKSETDSAQIQSFLPNPALLHSERNTALSKSSVPLTEDALPRWEGLSKGMYEESEILIRSFSCDNLGKAMPEHQRGENDDSVYVSMSSDSLHLAKKQEPHNGNGDDSVRLQQLPFCWKDSDINFQGKVTISQDKSHSNEMASVGTENVGKEVFSSNTPKNYKDRNDLKTSRDASDPVCQRIPLNKESMENNALIHLLEKNGTSSVEYCSLNIARRKSDAVISITPTSDSPTLCADSAWTPEDDTPDLNCRASSDEKQKTFEEIKVVSEKENGDSKTKIELNFDVTKYPLMLSSHTGKIDIDLPSCNTAVRENAILLEQCSAYLSDPCVCINDKSEFKQDKGKSVPIVPEVTQWQELSREDDIIPFKKWDEENHFVYATKSFDKDKDLNEIFHRFDQKEDANELHTNAMTQGNEIVSVKSPDPISVLIPVKNLDHSPTTPWKRLIKANIDSMFDNSHCSRLVYRRPPADGFYTNSSENQQDRRFNSNKQYDPPSMAEVLSFADNTDLNSTSQFALLFESFLGKGEEPDQQPIKTCAGFANNEEHDSVDQSYTVSCFAHENAMEMLSSGNNFNLHDESSEKESKVMPMKENVHETGFWSPRVDSELCQSFVSSASETEKDERNKFLFEINKSSKCQNNLSAKQLDTQPLASKTTMNTSNPEKHVSDTASDYSQRSSSAETDSEHENTAEGYFGVSNEFAMEENGGHIDFIIPSSDGDNKEAEVSSSTVIGADSSALIITEEIETFDSKKINPEKTCDFARDYSTIDHNENLMQGERAILSSESIVDLEVEYDERINADGSVKYSQKFKDIFCMEDDDSSLHQICMHKLCPAGFSNESKSSEQGEDPFSLTAKTSAMFRFGQLQETATRSEKCLLGKLKSNDIVRISSLPLNLAAVRLANNTMTAKPILALQRDPFTQWKRLVDSNIESMLLNEVCYPCENGASIRPFVQNYANSVFSEYLCRQNYGFKKDFSAKIGSGSLPIASEPIREENNDSINREQNFEHFKLFPNDSNANIQHQEDFFIKPQSTECQGKINEESFFDVRGTEFDETSDTIGQYENFLSQKLVDHDLSDYFYGTCVEPVSSTHLDQTKKDVEQYSFAIKTGNNVFVFNSPGTNSSTLHKDLQLIDEDNLPDLSSCNSCSEKNEGYGEKEKIDLYENQKCENHSNKEVSSCSSQNPIRLSRNMENSDGELTERNLDETNKTIKTARQNEDNFINMSSLPTGIVDSAECQVDQGTCAPCTCAEVTDFFQNSQKKNECFADSEKWVRNNEENPLTQSFDNKGTIVFLNENRSDKEVISFKGMSLPNRERQELETRSGNIKNRQEMIRKSGTSANKNVEGGDFASESIKFLQRSKMTKPIPAETSVKILEKNPTTQWKRLMETNIESMLSVRHGSHLIHQSPAVSPFTKNTESHEVQRIDSINTTDRYSHTRATSPSGETSFTSSCALGKQSNCFYGADESIDYCYPEFKKESSKQVNTVSNRNESVVDTETNINLKTKEHGKYNFFMSRLEMIHTDNELDFASTNKKTPFIEENVHFCKSDLLEISNEKADEIMVKVNKCGDLLNENLYFLRSDTNPETNFYNTSKLNDTSHVDILKSLEISKGDHKTALKNCPSKSCDTTDKLCNEEKSEEHVTTNVDNKTDARMKHVINAASHSSQTFCTIRQGFGPNEMPPQTISKQSSCGGIKSKSSKDDGDQECRLYSTNLTADNMTLERESESKHSADICQSTNKYSTKLEPHSYDAISLFMFESEELSRLQKGPYEGKNKASSGSSQSTPMPKMKHYLHIGPINGRKENEHDSIHNMCRNSFLSNTNGQGCVDKINLDIETSAKKLENVKSTETAKYKRFSKETDTEDKQIKLFSLLDVVDSFSCVSSVTVLPPAPEVIFGKYVVSELREDNNKLDVSEIKSYDESKNPSKKGFLSQSLTVLSNVMKYIFGVSVLPHCPSDNHQRKLQTTARLKRPIDLRCLRDRDGLDKYVTEGDDLALERIIRDAARVTKRRQRRSNAKYRQQTSLSNKNKWKPKHYEHSTPKLKDYHVKEANSRKEHILITNKPNFSEGELSLAEQFHTSRLTRKNATGFDCMKYKEFRNFLNSLEIEENSHFFTRPKKQRSFGISMNAHTTPNDQALSEFFRSSEQDVVSVSNNQIKYSPEVVKMKDIIQTKGTLNIDCQRDIHLKRDELSVKQSEQSRTTCSYDSVEDHTDAESENGTESSGTDVKPSDILRYSLECLLEVVIQRGKF